MIPGLSVAKGRWLLDNYNSFPSVRNLVRMLMMMFFPLADNGPNSAGWNLQKFRKSSLNSAISMFCKNKVLKVLTELIGFTHYEVFLVWHLGDDTPFYRSSFGQIILICTSSRRVSNYWWISAVVMTSTALLHLPVLHISFVSFHNITYTLIYRHLCFDFLACVNWKHVLISTCNIPMLCDQSSVYYAFGGMRASWN